MQAIAEVPLADERTTEAHDFDALFREAGSGVFRTLYAYTAGRRDIAEEAMAEAFARALARSNTIRDPVAWIYRTAFRLANDELRAERRRGPAPTDTETAPPELGGLIEALRSLSPNQRAAIVLRHVLDLGGSASDGHGPIDGPRPSPSREEEVAGVARGRGGGGCLNAGNESCGSSAASSRTSA